MRFGPIILSLLLLCAGSAEARVRMTGDLPRRDGRPLVDLPGLETEYGVVRTSEGVRLRTILTRPEGATGRLPAIFIAQWVSCSSIDFRADRDNLVKSLATRAGMVMLRVERSGSGDSEGVPCEQLDYDTEIRHYREALDQLARHAWVDPDRIVIHGISLGTTTAPFIAEGRRVAGLLVQGSGAYTYLERMINFDRIHLERSGRYPPETWHDEMARRIAFHHEYLIRGRTPAEIAAARPELAGVWASILGAEPGSHYGRPFAWHQQAARRNFAGSWAAVEAPVMVVYGSFDQFEPRGTHALIVDIVNRRRPGTATLVGLQGADHDLVFYPNVLAAYAREGGEQRPEAFLGPAIEWLRRVTGLAPAASPPPA